MVSIKSLAVLLFAAAVTAAPLAGEKKGGGHGDSNDITVSKNTCEADQEFHCCNDDGSSANAGLVSLLNNPQLKCNSLGVNVLAVPTLTDNSMCKGTIVCCPGDNSQTGLVNANAELKCTAPGLN
ncbi:hypothetical protein B9Z19DRAFT_1079364 [Tuber borchii]|uniref:Hydrophobin n=1 Tax=Tuber borchii TaxID=42251 RepID=A0A2T6ZY73_TUBBO|nr:hypothetical protein B9Z19DRAFT_1079364 [Tuber borchii]